jgi:hypothetical protein
MIGIKGVRFIEQKILTKSVCYGFQPIQQQLLE